MVVYIVENGRMTMPKDMVGYHIQMEMSIKECGLTIWPMDWGYSEIKQEGCIKEGGIRISRKAMVMNITLMGHCMKGLMRMDSKMDMVG